MRHPIFIHPILLLSAVFFAGCETPEKSEPVEAAGRTVSDFTGTWATDGTGAGGIRTMVQEGNRMTGKFDEGKGRYDGTVEGRKLVGRFWWNEDLSRNTPFEETPEGQRGSFDVTLSLDGNAFTGRSTYEGGEWASWNGLRVGMPAGAGEDEPVADFTGTWATDGTGAGGVRTMVQEGNRMTGRFDEGRGRYGGVVKGRKLAGRFWWNEDSSREIPFEETPVPMRGYFEVTLSEDGDSFTGRSKYDGREWVSWNGLRTGDVTEPSPTDRPPVDFTGTWVTDGTGAGGKRTMVREGDNMTGSFDEGRGRYDGTVEGRKLVGQFWWNEDPSKGTSFEETPDARRGCFEVTFSEDGNSFTGRSKYENGEWESWNGLRTK